jgi:hypothetical protein
MLTNDARYAHEIKSRISMAKAAFNKKKILLNTKLDLNLWKKLGHLGKAIRNTWEVSTCSAREGWRSVGLIV